MAYRFKLEEDFDKGLVRIGAEQLERAVSQLEDAHAGVAVHETRKSLKRIRALLRLVRNGIGNAAFKRENARLGDIGRMLSSSRDQTVIRATIDWLAKEQPTCAPALRALRKAVPDPARGEDVAAGRRLAGQAIRRLKEAGRAWRRLELGEAGLDVIAGGLARGLAELREAQDRARDGDDEAVHDWRKAVQRHWRHMLLMREAWPPYFEARAAEAKQVSELLGLAQDLTLLIARARDDTGKELSEAQANAILDLAAQRRDKLRAAAREHCKRLVAEGPDGHARRAGAYWRSAHEIAALEPTSPPEERPATLAAARDGLLRNRVKRSGRRRAAPSRGGPGRTGRRKAP